jgi:hypothetical protein
MNAGGRLHFRASRRRGEGEGVRLSRSFALPRWGKRVVVFGSAGASPSRVGERVVVFGSAGASPSRGERAREAGLSHEDSADDLSDGFYVLNTDKFLVQS